MISLYENLVDAIKQQEPVCLCVIVDTKGSVPRRRGSKLLVYANGRIEGTVGGGQVEKVTIQAALDALTNGQPNLLKFTSQVNEEHFSILPGGEVSIYLEPQIKPKKLLIIGAGHIGRSLAKTALNLDFQVILADDREELLRSFEELNGLEIILSSMKELPKHLSLDRNTYIVCVTPGSEVDIAGLPELLKFDVGYIGVIGSKNRWENTIKGLLQTGVSEEKIQKIHNPIGLKIDAETPDEIAISVLAELIQLKNNKQSMHTGGENVEKLPHSRKSE